MRIVQHGPDILRAYSTIPIRFAVDSVYEVASLPHGEGFELVEKRLDQPYTDNFDDEDGPLDWSQSGWDLSNWGFFVAYEQDRMVGGAIVAYDTPGIYMLQGRKDLACLWDIRVHPDFRGQGIGKALLDRAKDFASQRNCKYLKIETQNTNVRANRFYQSQGCVLSGINRYAYERAPEQVQMIWFYIF